MFKPPNAPLLAALIATAACKGSVQGGKIGKVAAPEPEPEPTTEPKSYDVIGTEAVPEEPEEDEKIGIVAAPE